MLCGVVVVWCGMVWCGWPRRESGSADSSKTRCLALWTVHMDALPRAPPCPVTAPFLQGPCRANVEERACDLVRKKHHEAVARPAAPPHLAKPAGKGKGKGEKCGNN